jgi:hypothetical protein
MRILILILALLASGPVLSAEISWSVETSAGTVTQTSPTLSDPQMDRFINWVLYAYPQVDGNGDPLPVTNAVKAAAVRDWMTAQWHGTKTNVLRWEKQEAAQAARDGVADLE